jgi:uncharacterized short protein YbdD (DUF466 family)
MIVFFRKLIRFAENLAGELADENAYRRHLAATSRQHSPEEWRRFIDARLERKYQSGKCC